MLDQKVQYIMSKTDEIWTLMVPILNEKEIADGGTLTILATIAAKILSAFAGESDDIKKIIKKEFMDLLDEKLGKNNENE